MAVEEAGFFDRVAGGVLGQAGDVDDAQAGGVVGLVGEAVQGLRCLLVCGMFFGRHETACGVGLTYWLWSIEVSGDW